MRGPLVLVGLMGSGKSSVGRELARLLGWEWADLDLALERRHRASVARQFERQGEAAFRRREAALLKRLAAPAERVLSTGGGVVLRAANRSLLKRRLTVHLAADPTLLAKRLSGAEARRRPLLKGGRPLDILRRQARERGPHYRACASLRVSAAGTPRAVALRILKRLGSRR